MDFQIKMSSSSTVILLVMVYFLRVKEIQAQQLNNVTNEPNSVSLSYNRDISVSDTHVISSFDPQEHSLSGQQAHTVSYKKLASNEEGTENQIKHVRRKRGSLDPILGLRPRRILYLDDIVDELTTMDNSRGYRTTFWPLRHRPPPCKKIPFWSLLLTFCCPLLCCYLLTACALTACFGKFFRKANCLSDSLGFLRTCCLMNCCFCCAHRVASKYFSEHVITSDDPCCKPICPQPQSKYRCRQTQSKCRCAKNQSMCREASFGKELSAYDMQTENINSPFMNFPATESCQYNAKQNVESVSSKSSRHSMYRPTPFSRESMRHSISSNPIIAISSLPTPYEYSH
uniref:Uncharacterized protein n=1 Tax=Cacopsylla melanoneura TaxID=428564 RepID=A0A8D9E7W6_9HEMI